MRKILFIIPMVFLFIIYSKIAYSTYENTSYMLYVSVDNFCVTSAELHDNSLNLKTNPNYVEVSKNDIVNGICIQNNKTICYEYPLPSFPSIVIYPIYYNKTNITNTTDQFGKIEDMQESIEMIIPIDHIPKEVISFKNGDIVCRKNVLVCVKDDKCNNECPVDPDCKLSEDNVYTQNVDEGMDLYKNYTKKVDIKIYESNNEVKYVVIAASLIILVVGILLWMRSK